MMIPATTAYPRAAGIPRNVASGGAPVDAGVVKLWMEPAAKPVPLTQARK